MSDFPRCVLAGDFKTPDVSLALKKGYDEQQQNPQSREAGGRKTFLSSCVRSSAAILSS